MHAVMRTTKGDIRLELYPDKTPVTVANFVGRWRTCGFELVVVIGTVSGLSR